MKRLRTENGRTRQRFRVVQNIQHKEMFLGIRVMGLTSRAASGVSSKNPEIIQGLAGVHPPPIYQVVDIVVGEY